MHINCQRYNVEGIPQNELTQLQNTNTNNTKCGFCESGPRPYCNIYCDGVHKMAKLDTTLEPKITCSKIFIFQPILEFQTSWCCLAKFPLNDQFHQLNWKVVSLLQNEIKIKTYLS
jgi:hypothetical protein